jgi:hypothetical protein
LEKNREMASERGREKCSGNSVKLGIRKLPYKVQLGKAFP